MIDHECSPHSDSGDKDNLILNLIEDYSKSSIDKLKVKRITQTKSKSLNELLNGGIRSQEVVEFFGDDWAASGDFLIYLVLETLRADTLSEAVIITSNYSQNENKILDMFQALSKTTKRGRSTESILKRIFIVPCTCENDLDQIIDLISQRKYSTNSKFHLGIVTIHLFSSLFEDSNSRAIKNGSTLLSFKLRSLAIEMNCSIFVSNFQTQLSISNDLEFDPFLESDNPVFSKLSDRWHSTIDTRIYLEASNMNHLIKFKASVVKSRKDGYPVSTFTLCKTSRPKRRKSSSTSKFNLTNK